MLRLGLCFLIMVSSVSCVARIPLKADEDLQIVDPKDRAPGCVFDGQTYELEDTWHPDLGPPFGVMYCVRCECLAIPRKGQITGKVRCRNFKHECPKPDCPEPVLLPNQCCKVCPRDAGTKLIPVRVENGEERTAGDNQKTAEYLAIISNPVSRHAARGIFHFDSPSLHYTLQFTPGFRPTSVVFQDEAGNALFTQSIDESRVRDQKFCGVWDRIPRMFRRTLGKNALQIALTTREDPKGFTKGILQLKRAMSEETYSAVMLPGDPRRVGSAGIASVGLGAEGNSLDYTVLLQGMPAGRKDVKQMATITLQRVDDRVVIRETSSPVSSKTGEVTGRLADLNAHDMKWLARGKLLLTLRLTNAPDFDLTGQLVTKPTCNIFQAVLYDVSRPKPQAPAAGVALFELKPDGNIEYRVDLQGFSGRPSHLSLETNPKKGRRRIVDDLAGSYSAGWTNGTYTKQLPKDIQNLLSDDLVLSIAQDNSQNRMQGQVKQVLYEEVHGRTFPSIIPENPAARFLRDASGSAVAWFRLDENCYLNYDIFIDGFSDAYTKNLQLTLYYMYNQQGTQVRKQSQLENFKKFKSTGRVKNLKNDVLMGMPNGTIELQITAKDELEPRLRGRVSLVDDCSSRHKFNGFVMEDPANTIVPTYTCQYKEKSFEDGSSWKSEHKECAMCSCQRGKIICEEMVCPKTNCRNPVKLEGDCCATCPTVSPLASRTASVSNHSSPAGCYLDKKWHKPGSTWHPYIVPFGHSKCAVCTCMPGTHIVNCTRTVCPPLPCSEAESYRENPSDCCKKCPEPAVPLAVAGIPNDTLADEGSVTTDEDLLRVGGCRFQALTHRNGAEWHPRVQPFGVMNCVLCRCKDGKPSCKRQKCPRLSCPLIRKDPNECCPRCTDQNDPKARPNRRGPRRKQRTRRRD